MSDERRVTRRWAFNSSLITHHSSLPRGYFDHRGAQELVAEAVAPLHLLHDCVGFYFVRRLGGDGLVHVRVEELADRGHGLDAEAFEHAAELSVDQLDAVQEVAELVRLFGLQRALGFEGALEVVDDGEEAPDDFAERAVVGLGPLALGALAVVVEVRLAARELVGPLVPLLAHLLQLEFYAPQ